MPRYLRYDEFGGPEVLDLVEVDKPTAGPGEIVVRVLVAGLNPVDYKIFRGYVAEVFGATLPSGVGNDLAGVVESVGAGVTGFEVGQRVLGGVRNEAVADFVVATPDQLLPTPEGLSDEVAGSLWVAGRTAKATVDLFGLTDRDTVLVSAAAGGVGILAAQLAVRTGATVLGTASPRNHELLRSLGVVPVDYAGDLVANIRAAAPSGITAALDNNGRATIDAALALGLPADRINTVADHGAIAELGIHGVGGAEATPADLAVVASLLAEGDLILPVDEVFPIERSADAYRALEGGHVRGKIVIVTE